MPPVQLGVAVAVRMPRGGRADLEPPTAATTPVSCISDSFGDAAWPPADPAAHAPERVDFSARDTCEKEVVFVDTGLSCRIESVVAWDEFPEFVPQEDEPDERPPAVPEKDETGTIPIALRADSVRRCSTPLAISRASMRQGWEDTPPVKINLSRLGRLSMPPPLQNPRGRMSLPAQSPRECERAGSPASGGGLFRFTNWSQLSVASERPGSPASRFYGAGGAGRGKI